MKRFSPAIQWTLREQGLSHVECNGMKYERVESLLEMYGRETVHTWLAVMVEDLNDYCGVRQKMTDKQKDEVAHILMCECKRLNIAEVALFFLRVKSGVYGEYYGILDPVKTMSALRKYMHERGEAIGKSVDAEDKRKRDVERERWAAEAMSVEALQEAIDDGRLPMIGRLMKKEKILKVV